MKKSAKLIFFGTEDFSATSLKELIRAGWNVAAVVTKPDFKSGRGQKLTPPSVKTIAAKHGIPVLQPISMPGVIYEIASLEPTHGILVAFGKIIPGSLIDIFPGGIINVHPSLLPAWRGASPIESVILNNEPKTGISLMQLSAGMDEGPIYAQKTVVLTDEETRPELMSQLAEHGARFLGEKLPRIVDGSLRPKAQDASLATYAKLISKSAGAIDWTKSAETYEKEVRAYLGFPKSTAKIGSSEVIITKSRIAKNATDGDLVMQCHPGYLEILELVAPSGKTMSGVEFKRGYRG